jgi:uncharacterized SAM-binding protein YcdF (DUF218 family)
MVPFWLVLGVVCTIISLKKPFRIVFSRLWVRIALSVCGAIIILFIAVIAINGSRTMPKDKSDFVLVLGCQVDGSVPSKTLQHRLDAAYRYLIAYRNTTAVLSGGQGGREAVSEAEAMYRDLTARGVGADRLILEDQSTDTYENIKNSLKLLRDAKNLRICVITSDFHMLRAKLMALKLGITVSGYGAPTDLLLVPNYYVREMLAILKDMVIH